MILIDTNIFLEALLEQDRTPEVRSFFETIDLDNSYITDFSFYRLNSVPIRKE